MSIPTSQYPLAHDAQGEPIAIPETAVAWRVRRLGGTRGRPPYAYARNGAPLVVPIDADAEMLRAEGLAPGGYRLEALDSTGKVIPGILAHTQLGDDRGAGDGEADDDDDAPTRRHNIQDRAILIALRSMRQTIEAQAQVIVESKKADAEFTMAVAKRVAGPPPRQPEQTKALTRAAMVEALNEAQPTVVVAPEGETEKKGIDWEKLGKAVEPFAPVINMFAMAAMQKFGIKVPSEDLGAETAQPPPAGPAGDPTAGGAS